MVHQTNKAIERIRACMLMAQELSEELCRCIAQRHKFQSGDFVFLSVSSMRRVKRIGSGGKISRQCIIHFEVLVWVGAMAYRIAMPTPLLLVMM